MEHAKNYFAFMAGKNPSKQKYAEFLKQVTFCIKKIFKFIFNKNTTKKQASLFL